MSKTAQSKLASMFTALALLALAAVVYLSFFYPKVVAKWAAEEQTLSGAGLIAWKLSLFCRHYGLLLLPLLIGGFAACVLWRIISTRYHSTQR